MYIRPSTRGYSVTHEDTGLNVHGYMTIWIPDNMHVDTEPGATFALMQMESDLNKVQSWFYIVAQGAEPDFVL
jgi:hypothetical protein